MNEGQELIIIRKSYTPETYPPIVEVCGKAVRDLNPTEVHYLKKIVNDLNEKIVDEVLDD